MNINLDLKHFLFSVDEKVGVLSLNRPSKLNALNSEVLYEFGQILKEIEKENTDFALRGLIIAGVGEKAFIAGADISEMAEMTVRQAYMFGELGQKVTMALEELPIPSIACVQGFALGGGCEMAMACDFILATPQAVFGQPEVKLGLIPGFGGTQRLAKIIGRQRAREIIYTGRNIKADEAYQWGLVNHLLPNQEECLAKAKSIIMQTSNNSPLAVRTAKKAINQGVDLPTKDGLKKELDAFSSLFDSFDMKEGTKAFLEKRSAQFKGN